MNGVHDLGGMHGFGPVRPDPAEPLFHAPWERRALGLTLAMGAAGQWNIDQARAARESLPPVTYLQGPYYRIWTLALERLMLARGLVTAEELTTGHARQPPAAGMRVLQPEQVDAALARGTPTAREAAHVARPRFAPGERVRARMLQPAGHTRLPRYVRGHLGTVVALHGLHVFADRHAASPSGAAFDEAPQWLYTVAFDSRTLWGEDAEADTTVSVEAWESYLQAAT